MKIDDFLKEEMNWANRDLEYRPVIGYLKVTELLQKWGKKQLFLHVVSQQRELLFCGHCESESEHKEFDNGDLQCLNCNGIAKS